MGPYLVMHTTPPEKLNIQNPVWHTLALANRRLTGCWKLKIIGGASFLPESWIFRFCEEYP